MLRLYRFIGSWLNEYMAGDISFPTKTEDVVCVGPLRALRWKAIGNEEPHKLLLVHGVCVGAHVWRKLGPYLAGHGYTTYAVWLRHHHPGADRRPLRNLCLQDYAEDIAAAARAIGGVVLVGHSMGGLLAQMAAAVCDASGLALLCSAPPRGIPAIPRASFVVPAARKFMGRPFARQMMAAFGGEVFHERLNSDQREQLRTSAVPEPRRVARQLAFWPPHVSRGRIRCPVYVGGGDDDPVITPWVTRKIARRYNVVPSIYQQRGHMPNLEVGWERVGDDLLRWMHRF